MVKQFTQVHTTQKKQSWYLNAGGLAPGRSYVFSRHWWKPQFATTSLSLCILSLSSLPWHESPIHPFLSFFSHARSMKKFPSQGSNPCHTSNPSHSSGSLSPRPPRKFFPFHFFFFFCVAVTLVFLGLLQRQLAFCLSCHTSQSILCFAPGESFYKHCSCHPSCPNIFRNLCGLRVVCPSQEEFRV